jgi:hypothetical protein
MKDRAACHSMRVIVAARISEMRQVTMQFVTRLVFIATCGCIDHSDTGSRSFDVVGVCVVAFSMLVGGQHA